MIAALLRFAVGEINQLNEVAGGLNIAIELADFGQVVHLTLQAVTQARAAAFGFFNQRFNAGIFGVDQRQQQMHWFKLVVAVAYREGLRFRNGSL